MRFRTAYEPFREIETMKREFARDFEALARAFPLIRTAPTAAANPGSERVQVRTGPTAPTFPPARLWEDETAYFIEVVAPGFEPDKFEVTHDEGLLTISGERTAPAGEGARRRAERWSGKFTRTAKLIGPISADDISAEYRDGVLKIVVPKAEAAKPRRIQVKTA